MQTGRHFVNLGVALSIHRSLYIPYIYNLSILIDYF